MVESLVLTITRRCNQRCAYCPTARESGPSLDKDDVLRAIDIFCGLFGGGEIKLFGGEPLLSPDVVQAAISMAEERPEIRRIHLSTNGIGLDHDWLALLRDTRKTVLTISLDGHPEDHRRFRNALPGVPDAYDHIVALREDLLATPRVVITQTIAPPVAERAGRNFRHLLSLGFWRFNILPCYFHHWRGEEILHLRQGLDEIRESILVRWRSGRRTYIKNLFVRAQTPLFNSGLVVDCDGSIHPTNVALSEVLEQHRELSRAGTLDAPPSRQELAECARNIDMLMMRTLSPRILESTRAADHELTRFCRGLLAPYLEYRRREYAA